MCNLLIGSGVFRGVNVEMKPWRAVSGGLESAVGKVDTGGVDGGVTTRGVSGISTGGVVWFSSTGGTECVRSSAPS